VLLIAKAIKLFVQFLDNELFALPTTCISEDYHLVSSLGEQLGLLNTILNENDN
jgi:hypothetical protein